MNLLLGSQFRFVFPWSLEDIGLIPEMFGPFFSWTLIRLVLIKDLIGTFPRPWLIIE